jgi:hypothetical protein
MRTPLWIENIPRRNIPEVLTDVLNEPTYAQFVLEHPELTSVAIEARGTGLDPYMLLPLLDAADKAKLRRRCHAAVSARFS